MKILILNALYPTPLHSRTVGGAEKSVRNLAEALVKLGHEVEVIRAAPPQSTETREVVNGVVVYAAPIRNLYWPFDGQAQPGWRRLLWHFIDDWGPPPSVLARRLDTFLPDVMHTNTLTGLTGNAWRLARRRGVRVVHTLRDYYLICPRSTAFRKGINCERPCADCSALTTRRRKNTRLPNAVVGNSRATLDIHLRQGLFESALTKTAIGSLQEAGARLLPPRDRSQDPRVVFGFIGRITLEKGVDQLAHAYGHLPEGAASLVIAGQASEEDRTRLTALAGGREIRFLGFVTPETFYSAVDVVVVPSLWHEPLPRSVIDAIGFGRPVIGSDRGGTPESMGDPPFGWIFDPAHPEGLKNAMACALAHQPFVAPPRLVDDEAPLHDYLKVYGG